ncbi:MAG: hypothetical protein ACR2PL_07640 [Dehalococcoidia bacterium]
MSAHDEEAMLSAAARLVAQRRRRVSSACTVCGRPVEGTVRLQFCSVVCRLRARRRRLRESEPVTTRVPAAEVNFEPVPSLIARLDALRAESQPLDGCIAEVIEAAREERAASL